MALLDWDSFLERVEHNSALALELANDLLLTLGGRVDILEFALAQGELKSIEHAAHSLRGLVAPYGGSELLLLLKGIEERARSGTTEFLVLPLEIRVMIDRLKDELSVEIHRMNDREQTPHVTLSSRDNFKTIN